MDILYYYYYSPSILVIIDGFSNIISIVMQSLLRLKPYGSIKPPVVKIRNDGNKRNSINHTSTT